MDCKAMERILRSMGLFLFDFEFPGWSGDGPSTGRASLSGSNFLGGCGIFPADEVGRGDSLPNPMVVRPIGVRAVARGCGGEGGRLDGGRIHYGEQSARDESRRQRKIEKILSVGNIQCLRG